VRLGLTLRCCAAIVGCASLLQPDSPPDQVPATAIYLSFSGDGEYVEIPSAPDLSFGPAGLTVSAWLKPDALEFNRTEGSGYVYSMGKGERNHEEWAVRMYGYSNREKPPRPNRISFYLFNPDGGLGQGSFSQEPVRPGQWIHITATANKDETSIFRNGKYVRCDEYDGPTGHGCQAHRERVLPAAGNAPLRLGTRDLKSFFQGGLSQVRIWNRALASDEIRKLYLSNEVPQAGLAAEFLLDESMGDTIHDTTGRHQGKIVGARWVKLTPP
jgi:hypothetical protein